MAVAAALNVLVSAQTSDFSAGMSKAGQSLTNFSKLSKTLYDATRTDAERFATSVRSVTDAYALGKIDLDLYKRSVSKLQDDYSGATAKAEALKSAGERVFQQMQTPLEAYKKSVAELNELLAAGAISQQTYDHARAAATTKLSTSGARGQLNAAGKAVFDSTRTAAEAYAAKLRDLDKLLRVGAISQNTHARAVAAARSQYIATAGSIKLLADNTTKILGAQKLASSAMSKLGSIRLGAGALIGGAVAAGGAKHVIGLSADFQATAISMEVLIKDAAKSKALIEELYQFAAKTPFEFPDVAAAGKQLLGFGVATKDIGPTIKKLGELSSGLDIPLGELANLFGRNRNQAHIFSRDINEFTSRGIPIIQALAKQFGVANSEVMGLVETGKVGFSDVEKAIGAMTGKGGQFEGLTERLSKSMKGLASTAKDDLNSALRELGDVIGPKVISVLSQAAKSAKDLAEVHISPEKTDLSKGFATDLTRRNSVTGTSSKSAIRQAIKDNIEAQRQALKQDQSLNNSAMNDTFFNPGNVLGKSGVSRNRLNDLAKELDALQKRYRILSKPDEFDTKGAKISLDGLVDGAKAAGKAFESLSEKAQSGASAVRNLAKDAVAGFNKLEEGGKLISDLKMQGDTFAMNARQAAIYKAKLAGIPEFLLKIAQANNKRITQMEFDKRQTEAEGKKQQDLTDRFKSLQQETATPQEQLDKKLKEINELRKADFGATKSGKDVLDRAEAAARKDFAEATKSGVKPPEGNEAMLAGSREAFSTIFRAPGGVGAGNAEKTRQQQLTELKALRKAAQEQAKALKNGMAIIVGALPA